MYTESVQVTVDNVLSLLHAAKIYMVQNLIDKCLQRLKGKMLPENLCLIMEAAHIFGEPELRERSRNKILQNPKQVLTSDSLAELCSECLQSILEDNHLRLEEEEIFESVMKYSENICLHEQLPVTPDNQRKVLGKALQHIRFTLMDKTYFTDVVEPMGILKFDETLAVLKYFLNPQFSSTPFNTSRRNTYKIVNRFKTINSGWKYKRNRIDAISCECSENIQIHGILIYTYCDGAKEFNAKVTILDHPTNTTKVMQIFKVESDGEMKSYECIFNNPIYIPKGEIFTICLAVKSGKTTYWGEDGQDTVDNDGVSFTFMNSSLSLNNTTCDRGQIPGIIYTLDRIGVMSLN